MIYFAFITFCLGMLMRDFLQAYQEALDFSPFFRAIWSILTDIKFWLVLMIACFVLIFPFAYLLDEHEKQENSKIDAHIILQDGREFHIKKSEVFEYENLIEFTTENGEEIRTTLYTVVYRQQTK